MKQLYALLSALILSTTLSAQVVTLDPPFATQNDSVTIIYDATLGNAALVGVNQVYAHTGVITNLSSGPTDWQHVQGNWGTDDPTVKMTNLGNNKHSLKIHISTFYGVGSGETITDLAFVFRNEAGSVVGRESNGDDIFVPLSQGGFTGSIVLPTNDPVITINDQFQVKIQVSDPSDITLFHNGSVVTQVTNATDLTHTFDPTPYGNGKFYLHMEADDGNNVITDSIYYVSRPGVPIGTAPSGTIDGINYTSSTSVVLQLYAPQKSYVYVIGDFTDWEVDPDLYMTRVPSSDRYWVEITGLTPGVEYAFQYMINDEQMRVADVYADKILDPWNDQWIDPVTYPNLKPYPTETSDPVSVLQTDQTPYPWDNSINYTTPAPEDLVIYELLIRDFIATHDYQTMIDTLDYLDKLGINCIELMPINEFEGNESWGYNPSFFFAPDKYYGPKEKLKEFVEECHRRGIAVVMDIALNHSFGQNPQVRMYFDANAGPWGQPTANNPWFNETARHDFNVGYDYDHEAQPTKDFMDRIVKYWVQEYRIDGYRYDLSKGFTQNNTLGNIGAWNAYDQSRVDILNRIGNEVKSVKPDAIQILEHFADNSEETALSNSGFLLWGNMNHEYNEATMGYNSDLHGVTHFSRGWNDMHLVGFMESHDEQRLMYKNLNFGNSNSSGTYDVTDMITGLQRIELGAAFFYPVPGPKMLWQFGEVGYDFPINYCPDGTIDPDCRTANKPIRWDYLEDGARLRLKKVFAALINLRTSHSTFSTQDFNYEFGGTVKRLRVNDPSMNVVAIGNFGVDPGTSTPAFQHTGWWYEYFTGDSMDVTDVNATINLDAGEYRLYTDVRLETPDLTVDIEELSGISGEGIEPVVYPNPATDAVQIGFAVDTRSRVDVSIYNLLGSRVATVYAGEKNPGIHSLRWNGQNDAGQRVGNGSYIYRIVIGDQAYSGKIMLSE